MNLVDVALLFLGLAFAAGIARVVIGPTLADRAVAVDVCLFSVVGALALLSVRRGTEVFVDAVLIATLVGFVATVALARLVARRKS